ncbi:MAG: hypothetical protein KatS3mg115_0883 [Candidatus Poribacteria bacterium]|nr:MAG: hypothetical protein KatS3mg115_0883 [Candidatus Poribacteria bacterium]
MNSRLLILLAGFGLIGFLLFPRPEPVPGPRLVEWVPTARKVEGEPLHFPQVFRTEPIYETYDLGFLYRIDRVQVSFEQPDERGPKQFEVLVSPTREGEYQRALTFRSASRSYPWSVQRLPVAVEARWVQVVVNDWFSDRPQIREVRVGPSYRLDWNPIVAIRTSHYGAAAHLLMDGLRGDGSKWSGAEVREETVEQDGQRHTVPRLAAPKGPVWVLADLGGPQSVLGFRITTNGPDTNVRRFAVRYSLDGRAFPQLYLSGELPDSSQEVQVLLEEPISARFLRVELLEWYGEYPELEEVEVFTRRYRPYTGPVEPMAGGQYNPVLIRYDNCGVDNRRSPHLVQGYPFDRGEGDPSLRYAWRPNEEIGGEAPETLRTFAYHYDAIRLRYTNLDSSRLHWLQLNALQNQGGGRVQSVLVDGYLLVPEWAVPEQAAEPLTLYVPPEALADGEIVVEVHRLAGPNAVLSEAALYSALRPGEVAPEADRPVSKALRADPAPTVDGDPSDWFRRFPLPDSQGALEGYLEWSAGGLYVLLRVPQGLVATPRFEDTLDLFLDATYRRSPSLYQPGDLHLRFYRFGTGQEIARIVPHYTTAGLAVPEGPPRLVTAGGRRGGAYFFEAFLPRGQLLEIWDPQEDGRIGFNFIFTSHRGERWFLRAENPEDPPIQWQTVRLWGAPRAELRLYAQPPPGSGDPWSREPTTIMDAGDLLWIVLRDPDASSDPQTVETAIVELAGGLSGARRRVTLQEVDFPRVLEEGIPRALARDSQYFAAVVPTAFGAEEVGENFPLRGDEALLVTYRDPFADPAGTAAVIPAEIRGRTGVTGTALLLDEAGRTVAQFRAGDRLILRVEDPDLDVELPPPPPAEEGQPSPPRTITVILRARSVDATEPYDLLSPVLVEREPGVFVGEVQTEYSTDPNPEDQVLQVVGTQEVQLVYLDRIQETGRTRVPMVVTARVAIGATAQLRIRTPRGNFPPPGEAVLFRAGTPLIVALQDEDLNRNPSEPDRTTVLVRAERTGDRLELDLAEAEPDSGQLLGLVETRYGETADPENAVLEVVGNDRVWVEYVDALQGSGATRVPVVAEGRVAVGNDGTLAFVGADYTRVVSRVNPTDVLFLRVEDPDESGERVPIQLSASQTGDRETVWLQQASGVGVLYVGSVPTAYGREAVAGDGVLHVVGGDRIQAFYTDALRASGETDRTVVAQVTVNVGADGVLEVYRPVLGGSPVPVGPLFRAGETLLIEVRDPDLNALSEVIEQTTVQVWDRSTGDRLDVPLRETSGNSGIFQGTLITEYHTSALRDAVLQVSQDSVVTVQYVDAIRSTGAVQVPIQRHLGLELGTRGELHLLTLDGSRELATFGPGDSILVRVVDRDLNQDARFAETASVWVEGSRWGDALELPLRETGPNTGVFEARLVAERTADADRVRRDDLVLQVGDGEVVTVVYVDALDKTGEPNVAYARRVVFSTGSERTLLLTDAAGRERGLFRAGETLFLELRDPLRLISTQLPSPVVEVSGSRTGDRLSLTLEPDPQEPGRYLGQFPTAYGVAARENAVLEVQGGEEVFVRYRSPDGSELAALALVARGVRARVSVVREDGSPLVVLTPGEVLGVRVEDPDQNAQATERERVHVEIFVAETASPFTMALEETEPDSGLFQGTVGTILGAHEEGGDALVLLGGETLRIAYLDPLVETGATNVEVVATCPVRRVLFAPFVETGPILDGYPEGWPLTYGVRTPERGALLWALWDREALYLFVQVNRSDPIVRDVTRWYEGSDALELHLSPLRGEEVRPEHLDDPLTASEYVFWICPKGGGPQGDRPYVGQARPVLQYNVRRVSVAARIREGAYFLEIRIPFAEALGGFDPWVSRRRDRLAFNFLLYRSKGPQQWWAEPPADGVPSSWGGMLYLVRPEESE